MSHKFTIPLNVVDKDGDLIDPKGVTIPKLPMPLLVEGDPTKVIGRVNNAHIVNDKLFLDITYFKQS